MDNRQFKTFASRSEESPFFSKQYFALRKKEQRTYTDIQVLQLPGISNDHVHSKEWQIRKQSCSRILKYLISKRPTEILEVGCGNGWLSNRLSRIEGSKVTGMDINEPELQQAKRVFSRQLNLSFIYGNLHYLETNGTAYDIILFAASIQYFESLTETVSVALKQLKEGGEVHIIDSPFYSSNEVADARERTREYFAGIGFPGMERHYFHHSFESLGGFKYKMLYNPRSLKNKLQRTRNPFPWFRVTR